MKHFLKHGNKRGWLAVILTAALFQTAMIACSKNSQGLNTELAVYFHRPGEQLDSVMHYLKNCLTIGQYDSLDFSRAALDPSPTGNFFLRLPVAGNPLPFRFFVVETDPDFLPLKASVIIVGNKLGVWATGELDRARTTTAYNASGLSRQPFLSVPPTGGLAGGLSGGHPPAIIAMRNDNPEPIGDTKRVAGTDGNVVIAPDSESCDTTLLFDLDRLVDGLTQNKFYTATGYGVIPGTAPARRAAGNSAAGSANVRKPRD
ncbi:MAG: hypothetical protein P4L51_06060 [Puia sp.]|nr:hypothetical protein [Puia sp.]